MAAFTALALGSLAFSGIDAVQRWRAGGQAREAGERAAEVSESQAQLADYNAAVADLQAQDALDRGAQEENRFRVGVRSIIGGQRAAIAGANIDVSSGSAVDVQADAAYLGELDALQIRSNATREAWGFQVQAQDLRRRAEIARKEGVYLEQQGRQQQTQQRIGAVGSVLGTGVSLLQSRYTTGRG